MLLNFAFYSGPVFCLHLKLVMRSFTTSPNDVFFRFLCDFGGAFAAADLRSPVILQARCFPSVRSGGVFGGTLKQQCFYVSRSWTGEGGGTVTLALQNYAFGNFYIITHFLFFNNLGNVL